MNNAMHHKYLLCMFLVLMCMNSEAEHSVVEDSRPAESYLQEGHRANRNGDIETAIKLYTKALDLDPDLSAAKHSIKSAMSALDVKKWASQVLSEDK